VLIHSHVLVKLFYFNTRQSSYSSALYHLSYRHRHKVTQTKLKNYGEAEGKLSKLKLKLNSMVSVRERTIPTERPPLVGEVIANFYG
jgi:hypothetical protein